MTEHGNTHQIYGSYVEHRGHFCQAVQYHPLDRNLHHVFEFYANYAVTTEISSEAKISLGSKLIGTKGGVNDFYGVGTSVQNVAKLVPALLTDYPGATIDLIAKIEHSACILAPVENPDYRRKATAMPKDWWLAETKDKLQAMVASRNWSTPIDEMPRRLESTTEELVFWSSAKPTDFSNIIAFANRSDLSAERLEAIIESLQ